MKCPYCQRENNIDYPQLIQSSYRCIQCNSLWNDWMPVGEDPSYDRSDYQVLYDFAFDMYDHAETARVKVETYLKNKP